MIRAIHHVCIETDRFEESLRFYTELLGFAVEEESRDFHGRDWNLWLRQGEAIIELQTPKRGSHEEASGAGSGLRHLCLRVDALEAFLERLEARGFREFLPGKQLYQVKGSPLSKLRAPEGTIIELRE